MSDTNIRVGKVGNINANNNKGVVNLLAVSQDIQNAIKDLTSASATNTEQSNIQELFEKLCKEIENTSELSDKQKEKALKQVKELVEAFKESSQPDSDFQERADNAITMIKGLLADVSNGVEIFKSLSAIASLFGII